MANTKKAVIQKQIDGILYDLMVKTNTENVVMEDGTTSLSAFLSNILYDQYITAEELDEKLKQVAGLEPEQIRELVLLLEEVRTHSVQINEMQIKMTATNENLENKVDKITGKGLSTEDFTTALKTKLETMENSGSGGGGNSEGLLLYASENGSSTAELRQLEIPGLSDYSGLIGKKVLVKSKRDSVRGRELKANINGLGALPVMDVFNGVSGNFNSAALTRQFTKAESLYLLEYDSGKFYGYTLLDSPANTEDYGLVTLSDSVSDSRGGGSGAAATPKAVKEAYDKASEATGTVAGLQAELGTKAPTDHASTSSQYGAGTANYYGHVKLSDAVDKTSGTGAGIAATPTAVKKAYDLAEGAHSIAGSALNTAEQALQAAGSGGINVQSKVVTLTTGGWTGSGPYTQTAMVQGVTANNHLIVSLSPTASANQIKSAASAHILAILQTANAVTFSAYNEKPTVDLPITLLLIG